MLVNTIVCCHILYRVLGNQSLVHNNNEVAYSKAELLLRNYLVIIDLQLTTGDIWLNRPVVGWCYSYGLCFPSRQHYFFTVTTYFEPALVDRGPVYNFPFTSIAVPF